MNAIEAIDPVGGTMTVQAGVALQRVQEAAAAHDLQFALDLGARGSCTIGGNIATNAGGVRVIRYGMMRQQVLGLEAVLADGRVISSMNHMLKNNAGYDLKQLFIGSEGTLGIVTRAVLKLQPTQPSEQTALVACPSFEALTGLLQQMGRQLGGALGTFEVMWRNHYRLLTEESGRHAPPLATTSPYYALIESLGVDDDSNAARFNQALESAFDDGLIQDAVVAHSETQRQGLWAIREDIEGRPQALSPCSPSISACRSPPCRPMSTPSKPAWQGSGPRLAWWSSGIWATATCTSRSAWAVRPPRRAAPSRGWSMPPGQTRRVNFRRARHRPGEARLPGGITKPGGDRPDAHPKAGAGPKGTAQPP